MKDHPLVRLLTDPAGVATDLAGGIGDALAAAKPWIAGATASLALGLVVVVVLRAWHNRSHASGARRVAILPPPEVATDGALTLWMGLHAILRPAWRRLVSGQPHLAWEVVAEPDAVSIFLWVPQTIPPGLVERAVESAWPGARAMPAPVQNLFEEAAPVAVTELVLAEPEWYPIGDAPDDTEPLRLALGTMTALGQGERAVTQVLARPATSAARFRLRRAARHLRKSSPATPFWATPPAGRFHRTSRPTLDPTIDPDVRAVISKASSPLWQCMVRVAVSSHKKPRARGKIHALAGAFAVFEGRNGFRRRRVLRGAAHLERRAHSGGYLLSVPELAQLAALPSESVPGLDQARARSVAPPRALPERGLVLGVSDHPGTARRVAIATEDARHHIHLVGETGTGKSTLVAQMVLADAAAGRSAVVIDPKGDLVEAIIERLPRPAIARTCLIDPDDADTAVGLNVLSGENHDLVVDHVIGVFKRIYEPWWGPRTDDIMRAVCLTLMSIPGATLTEIPLLLSHEGWRREVRSRLEHVPGLGSFWMWYERLGEQQRANMVAPLLNKLRAFLLRGPVRAIVGQAEPRLNMDALLDSGGLLFVRIPKGTIGEETSRLLGAFVVARVWQAVMRRASMAEGERADTTLYVDEMHNYLALPRSFEDLLAEARGYRLGLVLAHQHMNQLPRDMREALAANARTKVVFACAPEDATQLERHFSPHLSAHDLHNLAAFQGACRPCLDGGHGAGFTFATEPLPAPAEANLPLRVRRASRDRYGLSRPFIENQIRERQRKAATKLLPPKPKEGGSGQ